MLRVVDEVLEGETDWEKFSLELLERRRKSLNKGRTDYHLERKERGMMMKNNILEIINSYTIHNEGILVKILAKLVNLSDRSITHYIQELKEEGKIKTNKKTGKIVSTSEVFKDPIINAEVFGYYFRSRLLLNNKSNSKNLVLNEDIKHIFSNDQTKESYIYDFTSYKKLYEPKFSENDIIEKMLFEFSNRIGSFITYLIIYSMNPDNYNYNYNNNNNLSSLSNKNKDEVVKEVIKKGILSITPFLGSFFRDIYDKRTGKYPYYTKDSETEEQYWKQKIKYFRRSPKYIINEKESILSLLDAFKRLYPLMSYEFEKIMPEQNRYLFKDFFSGKSSGIEAYKKYMREFYELLRKQEICKHEYEEKSETNDKKIIEQCKLCNYMTKFNKAKKKKT